MLKEWRSVKIERGKTRLILGDLMPQRHKEEAF